MSNTLRPVDRSALHVAVDMQRLFGEDSPWQVPSFFDIVPAIRRIGESHTERTLFTRFLTPASVDETRGTWRRYYERWPSVTLEQMPAEMLELVPALAPLAAPERICDKTTFSGFTSGGLEEAVRGRGADTLVLTGVETDVCVLATALAAVDRGLRVIIVADAVTSASSTCHEATLEMLRSRYGEQIEVTSVEHLLAAWTE
jgi:nicotinamidase-related amidase